MNIVFVFDGLKVGGIEKIGINYTRLLLDRGHRVSVVNLVPSENDCYKQLPELCGKYGVGFSRTIVPYRYARLTESGVGGTALYAIVSCFLSVVCLLFKLFARIKLRNLGKVDVVVSFSGHFNDLMFVASNIIPGKKMAWLHGAQFEYKVISEGYFALYRKIKNLVCLSNLCDYTVEKFNKKNHIRKEKIYNPILTENVQPDEGKVAELKEKYGEFALMVGRLAPDKDQKTAILAVKYVNAKREKPLQLLLVGDGESRQDLERFTHSQEAEGWVHFIGQQLDIQNYYKAAHVYVHSSPSEGLPTVLLEALAYEVPVASTDSMPGAREILGDNECGLLSPVGDWKELGKNIDRLCIDSALRTKLNCEGKKRLEAFTPENSIRKLECFIKTLYTEG